MCLEIVKAKGLECQTLFKAEINGKSNGIGWLAQVAFLRSLIRTIKTLFPPKPVSVLFVDGSRNIYHGFRLIFTVECNKLSGNLKLTSFLSYLKNLHGLTLRSIDMCSLLDLWYVGFAKVRVVSSAFWRRFLCLKEDAVS